MINYIEGNLFDVDHQDSVIAHVCNNKGGWGKGFVVPLGKKYPKAKEGYLEEYGHAQLHLQEGEEKRDMPLGYNNIHCIDEENNTWVANMVAQTLYTKRPLYYNKLSRCMDSLVTILVCTSDIRKIVCPMFGSGLAGGDWNFIEKLIEDCWIEKGFEVDVYYLNKESLPSNWSLPNE